MAHLEYYNNIVGINDMIYDSHKLLLEKVTMELGQYDKFDELCEKFLDQPKLKAKVDKNAPKKPKSAFMLFSGLVLIYINFQVLIQNNLM